MWKILGRTPIISVQVVLLALGGATTPASLSYGSDQHESSETRGVLNTRAQDLGYAVHTPTRCERLVSDSCLFVFAVIADSHIRMRRSDSPKYLKATSISREVLANYVEDINAHIPRVDFTVHLGDIVDFGLAEEFAEARTILDSLECRLYPVVGNHDNFQYDRKRGWKDFAGMDSTRYTFDYMGFHFIVIDCTADYHTRPFVNCDSSLRHWVTEDLARNRDKPTIVFSHYNMWERGWDARFDTTAHYIEYRGMPELRAILEQSGNVVAVVNGHVHANRVEVHNDIYYVDVGATIVGPPTIRYFYAFPDSVVVTYDYISDCELFRYVTGLCPQCVYCFSAKDVCEFIEGEESDRQFTVPVRSVVGDAGND